MSQPLLLCLLFIATAFQTQQRPRALTLHTPNMHMVNLKTPLLLQCLNIECWIPYLEGSLWLGADFHSCPRPSWWHSHTTRPNRTWWCHPGHHSRVSPPQTRDCHRRSPESPPTHDFLTGHLTGSQWSWSPHGEAPTQAPPIGTPTLSLWDTSGH